MEMEESRSCEGRRLNIVLYIEIMDEYTQGRIPVGGAARFHAQLGQARVKTDLVDQTARYLDCELSHLFNMDSSDTQEAKIQESGFLGFFPCSLPWLMTMRCTCSPDAPICILNMSYPDLTVNFPFITLFDMFNKDVCM
jgi:hypothetical protein